jgi:NAD-dependent SIR2 family protein deacetylase
MSETTCLSCGKEIDEQYLKDSDMPVPLCPECYKKLKKSLGEVPTPEEYTDRCNLK